MVVPAAPAMLSGSMETCLPTWLVLFFGLFALHMLCYAVATAPSFKGSSLSASPHLAAHFLPQLVGFAVIAFNGGGAWFTGMPATEPPIDVYLQHGEHVSCLMIAFQLYELAACIPAKRLRGASYEMVGHHVITLLLSTLAYNYQAYHYWAPCFMGVAEISSVPLALVDFFKQFPTLKAKFASVNEMARNVFAVAFLACRGVYWPYSSVLFFRTSVAALAKGPSAVIFPVGVIYTFCVCNVLMTCLQWYWTFLILKTLVLKLKGDERHKEQ